VGMFVKIKPLSDCKVITPLVSFSIRRAKYCVTYLAHSALDWDVAVVASLCSRNWRRRWHETKLQQLGWQQQNRDRTM